MEPKIKLTDYLNIATNGGADFITSENAVIYISDVYGHFQLIRKDLVTGKQNRLTSTENRCTNPTSLFDGSVVYSSDKGGDENFQIFVLKGDEEFKLTKYDSVKFKFAFGTEKSIYLSANLVKPSRFDIYKCELPLTPKSDLKLVVEGFEYLPIVANLVNKSETHLILTKARSNLSNDILFFDTESQKLVNYTQKHFQKHNARFVPHEFFNAETLLITSDYKREFLSLALFNMTTGKLQWLEDDTKDTEGVKVCRLTKKLYFSKNDSGSSRFYKAEIQEQQKFERAELPLPCKDGVLLAGDYRSFTTAFTINEAGNRILFSFSCPKMPAAVWMVDLDSNELTQISQKIESQLDFVRSHSNYFESFDGLKVPYFSYYSREEKVKPTILMIHGGPEGMVTTAFNKITQLFVASGFNVITPNIRGSSGYGRTYLALDDIEKRLDSIKDIQALAKNLLENDERVGKQLIIFGGSYGGFAVLSAITEYPELFSIAVDIVGISNFVTFLKNTAAWRRVIREVEYGSLENDLKFLEKISPIRKVSLIQTPTIIIQGDNDERVPLSESIQIYEKLHENGVPTKLIRFADEGHGVVKMKNQIIQYQEILNFIANYI